ncbi:hypothetical protein [Roseimicrobium sp. ORNL1]|uniref:hypothetical protein n=1 Tax=Roseimicrobium sp. ORNL1 TaxID=2711231 RepID=UPI0013E12463|nr:hypothetical protein [Roseimicrobium sp. ORNL1]QIF03220.1 hypothetical protein G5S37_17385 [Roseimicrobium sp. ORNL1]
MPKQYSATGRIHVMEAKVLSGDSSEAAAKKNALLQSHVPMLNHPDIPRNARERVRMSHPDLQLQDIELHISMTQLNGKPVIEMSAKSTDPAFLTAYINEAMGEYVAMMRKEREREWTNTPRYKAFAAAALEYQQLFKELNELERQLKALSDSHTPDASLSALKLQIDENKKQMVRAREVAIRLSPGDTTNTPPFDIGELPKPEVFKHRRDPYSLVIHHPWRALVSLSLAWLLAVLLLPLRRAAPPEGPMPQPTEA